MMQVVSMSEARNNLKEIFDTVFYNNEEVIIHRKGRESIVLISLDDYNAIKETHYLLSNPNNRKHLLESIEEIKRGKVVEKEIIE